MTEPRKPYIPKISPLCYQANERHYSKTFSRPRLRQAHLEKIIYDQFRSHKLPQTEEARYFLDEVARCIRVSASIRPRIAQRDRFNAWCMQFAPWADCDALPSLVSIFDARWVRMTDDDELGRQIGLSYARRRRLRAYSIGSYDVGKEDRKKLTKERKKNGARERQAAKRLATGATPHSQSLARTRPWEAEGISRSTWYVRRAKNWQESYRTNSSPYILISNVEKRNSPTPSEKRREDCGFVGLNLIPSCGKTAKRTSDVSEDAV